MAKKDKRLWIDCAAGSELMDTQGETLSVEGADITDLEAGKGRWNDNHGKGFFNSLGMITEAKKIFKAEDCENERHQYYWDKIKAAYIYTKGYLYSDEDHSNAKAAAAILRNIHREDAPLAMKASVEGGVLSRGISDPARLARTKIHSVALTFTPANNATLVEPLSMDKSDVDWDADKALIKSVMHLAETNIPSFRHIERHASAHTIHDNILKIQELAKTLGIDIEISGSNPEEIMQQAVLNKVASSVYKINNLVKAFGSGADQLTEQDKYQRGIARLKSDPATPAKPKSANLTSRDTLKTQDASKVKYTNILKGHAGKAMRDAKYLDGFHGTLVNSGIHPDKASKIITKIQSHMQKSIDDVEKGDIARVARNIVFAGTMATGAYQMGPENKPEPSRKPAQEVSRPVDVHAHNSNIKDPDMMINPAQYGYDERKSGAKKEFHERRRKAKGNLKDMLKKALTAGYGGAGAPTSLSGGGVMQSESLDDGRKNKGMTYITCDDCGHEQVHMDHQVKCRECRKNFSLAKLKGHL